MAENQATVQGTTSARAPQVDTRHASYSAYEKQWRRCRDCYEGEDAIKHDSVAQTYLPPLDTHKGKDGLTRYNAYKLRALFFNAMSRTGRASQSPGSWITRLG